MDNLGRKLKKNAELVIESSISNIEKESIDKINEILQPKITEIDGKYHELLRIVDNGYKLKNSKITLVCSAEEKVDVETKLIQRIRAICETYLNEFNDFEEIKVKLSNKEIDMIIYVYKPTYEKDNGTFKEYIQYLIDADSRIPIIIYIDNGNRIDEKDEEGILLNQYPYSSIANMPTTLTTNIISMANLLSYEGGNENDC